MKVGKKNKVIILALAAVLVMAFAIPSMAGEPDADGYIACNAVKVDSYDKSKYYDEVADQRPNRIYPEKALGKADTVSGSDKTFVGLRAFDQITYLFGEDADKTYRIYNHPGEGVYDFSLIEVTWQTSWHVEATKVTLIDVEMTDGSVEDKVYIGTAFNRLAKSSLIDPDFQVFRKGDSTTTDIFFPSDVKSAAGVMLEDVTTDYFDKGDKSTNPDFTTKNYVDNVDGDDGYDLDAMKAYYTKEVGYNLDVDKVVTGTANLNATTFEFEIQKSGDPVAKGSADVSTKNSQTGVVFTDLEGQPITDWTKVLNNHTTYDIEEMNQGDYALTFSGEGVSENGEFTVQYSEKDSGEFPTISILATNNLDSTVASEVTNPTPAAGGEETDTAVLGDEEPAADEGEVLGQEEPAADEEVLGEEAKTADVMNMIPLFIVLLITMALIATAVIYRKKTSEE